MSKVDARAVLDAALQDKKRLDDHAPMLYRMSGTLILIGALLIIPAAAARGMARTPEAMAAIAAAIGILATIAGLGASYHWDTPAGPSIVSAAALAFVFAAALARKRC